METAHKFDWTTHFALADTQMPKPETEKTSAEVIPFPFTRRFARENIIPPQQKTIPQNLETTPEPLSHSNPTLALHHNLSFPKESLLNFNIVETLFPDRTGTRNVYTAFPQDRERFFLRRTADVLTDPNHYNVLQILQANITNLLHEWMSQAGFSVIPKGVAIDFVKAMHVMNDGDPTDTLAHATDHALVGVMVNTLVALLKQHALPEIQEQITDDLLQYGGAAASMHDYGKTDPTVRAAVYSGIKFDLQNNPYHREIFDIIKKHPSKGRQLLRQRVKDLQELSRLELQNVNPEHIAILELAQDIALHHHEKFTGGGYHNTIGDDIPLAARTTTIIDVFGALMERNRGYRSAEDNVETALRIMETDPRQAGSFDPRIFAVFKEHIAIIVEARNNAVRTLKTTFVNFIKTEASNNVNLSQHNVDDVLAATNTVVNRLMNQAGIYVLQ